MNCTLGCWGSSFKKTEFEILLKFLWLGLQPDKKQLSSMYLLFLLRRPPKQPNPDINIHEVIFWYGREIEICFILLTLRKWDKSAAIQKLFSFLGIRTKQPGGDGALLVHKKKRRWEGKNDISPWISEKARALTFVSSSLAEKWRRKIWKLYMPTWKS